MAAHNNHEVFQEAKCDLGLTDIIHALDYIKVLIRYVPRDNKLRDYYGEVIQPLNKFKAACLTDVECPKCGRTLFCSDLRDYEYVCTYCDENFYECEVK